MVGDDELPFGTFDLFRRSAFPLAEHPSDVELLLRGITHGIRALRTRIEPRVHLLSRIGACLNPVSGQLFYSAERSRSGRERDGGVSQPDQIG